MWKMDNKSLPLPSRHVATKATIILCDSSTILFQSWIYPLTISQDVLLQTSTRKCLKTRTVQSHCCKDKRSCKIKFKGDISQVYYQTSPVKIVYWMNNFRNNVQYFACEWKYEQKFFMMIWHYWSQLKNVDLSGIWTHIFRILVHHSTCQATKYTGTRGEFLSNLSARDILATT